MDIVKTSQVDDESQLCDIPNVDGMRGWTHNGELNSQFPLGHSVSYGFDPLLKEDIQGRRSAN